MRFLESARAVAIVLATFLSVHRVLAADDRVVLRRAQPVFLYWDEAHFEEKRNVGVTMWHSMDESKTLLPRAFVYTCAGRLRHDAATALFDVAPKPNSHGAVYMAVSVKDADAWDAFVAGVRAETEAVTPETCADFVRSFPLRFLAPDPPIAATLRGALCIQIAGRADEAFEARTVKLDSGAAKLELVVTGQSQRTCGELESEFESALRHGTPRFRRIDIQEEVEETLSLRTRAQLDASPAGAGPVSIASLDGRAIFSRWTSRTRSIRLGADPQTTAEESAVLDVAHFLPGSATPDFDAFAHTVATAMEPSREAVGVPLLSRTLAEHGADLGVGSFAVLCDPAKPGEASRCSSGSCAPLENAREICAGIRSRLD